MQRVSKGSISFQLPHPYGATDEGVRYDQELLTHELKRIVEKYGGKLTDGDIKEVEAIDERPRQAQPGRRS